MKQSTTYFTEEELHSNFKEPYITFGCLFIAITVAITSSFYI